MTDTPATPTRPEWVLVYTDGSVVAGYSVDDWLAAPARGVAAVIVPNDLCQREVLTGEMYLLATANRYPQASDTWGVLDHLIEVGAVDEDTPPRAVPIAQLAAAGVKSGRNVDSARWRELLDRIVAVADSTFGVDAGGTTRARPR